MRLTKSDVEKIEQEIWDRKNNLRPKLIYELKIAREQGDLSENYEYYTAKREKNRNESRIRYLDKLLKTATIIENNKVYVTILSEEKYDRIIGQASCR